MQSILLLIGIFLFVQFSEQNDLEERVKFFSYKVDVFINQQNHANSTWTIPTVCPNENYSMSYYCMFMIDNNTGLATCEKPRILKHEELGLELYLDEWELIDKKSNVVYSLDDFHRLKEIFNPKL